MQERTWRCLTVHAEQISDTVDEEDIEVAGDHEVEVPGDLSDDKAASAALDIFHSSVAVSCLDDFEFYVYDGDEMLAEDPEHESYSYGR